MSTIAVPARHVATERSTLQQLAWIEAKRFARHPVFLVGLVLGFAASAGERGPLELDYQAIPAFFIGVFGLAVASQLTRSTHRSRALMDAAPVAPVTRTAALCLACLVPATAGLAMVLFHRAFVAADPIPGWQQGTHDGVDWFVLTAVLPVVASLGGPLLGVAVGKWLRFPGATLLAVVVVIFWVNLTAYFTMQSMNAESLSARVLHMLTPYTAFGTPQDDTPTTIVRSYTGGVVWFAVWALALCALAVVAALWRDAGPSLRRQLVRLSVGVGAIAVCALALSVATGNDQLYDSTVRGTVPVSNGHG